MSEEHLGEFDKQVCESMENHDKHICQLAKKVAIRDIKELVDSPNFICENCARVAKSNSNLCKPKSLEKVSYHE